MAFATMSRLPAVDDLVVLLATVEHGSLSGAARSLGIAQPNASRALRRLESELGVELLRRGARGSTPTAAGALIADWAREVVDAEQRLVTAAAALRRPARPSLAIAASQTIAEELLPRWLAQLRAEVPGVEVALTVANSTEVGRLVSGGDVLGFVESTTLPDTLTVACQTAHVGQDRLVVVTSPDHPWARRTRPVSLDELLATPLVVREPGSGTRVSFEQAVGAGRLARPAVEVASNAAVRVAVAAGAGPAVLSELAVASAVEAGWLRAVMVEGLAVERPLRAVWATAASPALTRLVQLAAAG
ncbi:MAG: LysR family transcriptional regulator [Propionibacteriales bacterium]|nr:LysR family transcriptional regulator [Propionibacteriales bacterium]